ncbi:hypothetical protein [Polymorphospora rubra]|uniref:hypothetical protein n=1 Tax=Polymorphospora rubra TaxID=338584 RepID=UPI003F4D50BC
MTADLPADHSANRTETRPLYARLLFLKHLNPSGALCFCFFEGAIALGLLLALAELVSPWVVPVLPLVVAAMVKLNDVVAGAVVRSAEGVPARERARFRRERGSVVGRATVAGTEAARSGPVTGKVSMDSVRTGGAAGGTEPPATEPADVTFGGPGRPTVEGSVRYGDEPARRPERANAGGQQAGGSVPAASQPAVRAGDDGHETAIDERGRGGTAPGGSGRYLAEPPAVGRAGAGPYAVNMHPTEPLEYRPAQSWPAGIEEPDTAEQRARQSGSHRYE